MDVTARFAAFARAPSEAIDRRTRAVGRLSLADWIAVAIAGADEPVSRLVRARALAEGGAPEATALGGGRMPARAAAMVGATTGHALDYDDTHFLHIGHPTVAVAPAALAVAEREGTTLGAFLDAYLIGVEASCRIGAWMGRAHYEAGFHQTATAGAFGATLAAARLLGLDETATAHALGLCATRASGLKGQFGTMGKPMNAGFAAANGVECADYAALGASSALDGLEGAQGFGPTHAGAGEASALDGLGEAWVFADVTHKFHACCHGLHASLEALGEIRARGLEPSAVASVEIATHPRWRAVCDLPAPRTGLEAKFSYRLSAAMALSGVDTAALESWRDDLCARADLVALRERVRVRADETLADTAARVRVEATDGRVLEAAHDLADLPPLAEREARVGAKTAALIGEARAAAVRAALDAPDGTPVGEVVAAIATGDGETVSGASASRTTRPAALGTH